MTGVVVLNASHEPLGVVPLRRAIVQLIRERAVIVEAVPGAYIRSADVEMPVPRVVRLLRYVRIPYRYQDAAWSTRGILQRDEFRCCYCGKKATTVDHVIPRSRGGGDTWTNCVAACLSCNGKKADRTPAEAGMSMRYQPRAVTLRDTLIIAIAATGADMSLLGIA